MQWLYYFIFSFLVSLGINWYLAHKAQKSPQKYLKRFGGLGMIISFLIILFIEKEVVITAKLLGIIIGAVGILLFGVWDDVKNLSWKTQLAFQVLLALSIIIFGFRIEYISNPLGGATDINWWAVSLMGHSFSIIGSLIIMLWVISLMNAVNWSDGIDGLSGSIGMLGLLAIFFVSLRVEVNQPAVAIVSLIILGSVLGFWWLNVPVNFLEAGSSGSYFIGFILATLAIMAGTKIATTMIILALPLVDGLWVILQRKLEGKSVFGKDNKQRHLHYRLRNIGWSDRKILIFYVSFLSLMLAISLIIEQRFYKILWLCLEIFMALGIVYLAQRKEQLLKIK